PGHSLRTSKGREGRKQRHGGQGFRSDSRHARPARAQVPRHGGQSRIRHRDAHPSTLGRCPADRGRVALSRAVPHGGARAHRAGVGRDGGQPPSQVLLTDPQRTSGCRCRARQLVAPLESRDPCPPRSGTGSLTMKLRSPRLLRRILAVFRWNAQDTEMDQEMAFHIDAITREYVRSGMSEADAARAARKRFGNVRRHKEAGHDTRSGHLDELVQDMKSGLRQLTGAPTFALVATITLALGIGVNAAVFAAVKSALLDALPYTDADRLVRVYGGARAQQQRGPLSAGTISDIRDRQRSLVSL